MGKKVHTLITTQNVFKTNNNKWLLIIYLAYPSLSDAHGAFTLFSISLQGMWDYVGIMIHTPSW